MLPAAYGKGSEGEQIEDDYINYEPCAVADPRETDVREQQRLEAVAFAEAQTDYVKYSDGIAIGKKNEPFQFDPGVFMDDDGKLYLYSGFALAGNPILLDGSKPTEHGPMCFELDPSDMLTVLNGPSYIGVAGEKESILAAWDALQRSKDEKVD